MKNSKSGASKDIIFNLSVILINIKHGLSACLVAIALPAISKDVVLAEQWHLASPLPYRVQEIYPTVFEGHIVVAGGLSPDVDENPIGVSDRVVVYSLKDKSWKEGPKLPEQRHHPMLVVVEGRLLSFGGFTLDGNGAWHNSLDVMELVADKPGNALINGSWKKIAKLPAPLAETLSAVNDGKVHLVTGRTPVSADRNSNWNDQTDVDTHYIFSPKTLSWSMGPAVPTARNSACAVNTKGKLHTIGGRTVTSGNLSSHEAYNFTSGKWQTLAPLPAAQGGLACAVSGEHIYVFGGEYFNDGGGVYSDVWEYDIAGDSWQSVSQMPEPRHGLGALSIDGKVYVIAGATEAGGNKTSAIMSVFKPATPAKK